MEVKDREELDRLMEQEIVQGHFSGAILGFYEGDKEVFCREYGMADRENNIPMKQNAIFRMYSMSKPVAAVAAMILMERGLLDLAAPVSRYLKEYEKMYVYGEEKPRRITVKNLLNMTAGIVYPEEGPAGAAMDKLFKEIHRRIENGCGYSTREVLREIAKRPLVSPPEACWHYGLCADVLGGIIEEITGMSLGEFYRKEIFAPLDMKDTDFYVPEEKQSRMVQLYRPVFSEAGSGLEVEQERTLGLTKGLVPPAFESAGAGLFSTLEDSAHFCSMLSGKGIFRGKRILKKTTVEQFALSQLTKEQVDSIYYEHMPGYGYGNFMRVLLDPKRAGTKGEVGEFGWDGWAGPYMSVDCKNNRYMIMLVQVCAYSNWPLNRKIRNILYP